VRGDGTSGERRARHNARRRPPPGRGPRFPPALCLTIPAANRLIGHVGTECAPGGPCVIPVAPGPFGRRFGRVPWLAFGSLEFLAGPIADKAWVIALSIPLMMWLKERDERRGLAAL
jgi:hypothetical protein